MIAGLSAVNKYDGKVAYTTWRLVHLFEENNERQRRLPLNQWLESLVSMLLRVRVKVFAVLG